MENNKIKRLDSNRAIKLALSILLIVIWMAFVYFSYSYGKDYFDSSIRELDEKYYANYMETRDEVETLKTEIGNLKTDIAALNNSIDAFNDNMDKIFEDVSSIDRIVEDTSLLQESTTNKLEELDKRLLELIENLELLRQAPNE